MKNYICLATVILYCTLSYGQAVKLKNPSKKESSKETESEKLDLTDSQRKLSKEYIHHGLLNRTLEEGCKKIDKEGTACQGEGKTTFMGINSDTVKALSKAYALVIGAMSFKEGGGLPLKDQSASTPSSNSTNLPSGMQDTKTTQAVNAGGKKDLKTRADYCQYIAIGTEVVAFAMDSSAKDEIKHSSSKNSADAQRDLLYQAARSHEEKAKIAKMQTAGWGATTGCYAYMITAGGVDPKSWSVLLKTGAAALLTGFFFSDSSQNENYADELKKLANRLPKAGNCNPITETNCYCSQEETKNDQKYCNPYNHKHKVKKTSIKVSCIDKNLKADNLCECRKTDSCLSTKIVSGLNSEVSGLGNAFARSPLGEEVKSAFNGELKNGQLKQTSVGKQALVKGIINRLAKNKKDSNSIPLNKTQTRQAMALEKMGAPRLLARKIASIPYTPKMKQYSNMIKNRAIQKRKSSNKNNRQLTFGNSKRLVNKRKASGRNNLFGNMLNKFNSKPSRNLSNSKILNFYDKAYKKAQIDRNAKKSIFKIISRRYKMSGWKMLDE